MAAIELVITSPLGHQLAMWADGQLDLPKAPPFPSLGDGKPAVLVTVELMAESPDTIALFNFWYQVNGQMHVLAGLAGTWIEGVMRCVKLEIHEGIQATREWTEPLRREPGDGNMCRLYRVTPSWQPITKDVHRYVLAADSYAFAAPPPEEIRRLKGTIH